MHVAGDKQLRIRQSFLIDGGRCLINNSLDGLRILVLEDEMLIAMDVEDMCRQSGAEHVTIARSFDQATERQMDYDAAVIDVMIEGRPTFDFAHLLRQNGIPFVFATGHADDRQMFADFPGVPVVAKPYSGNAVVTALKTVLERDAALTPRSSP